MIKSALCYSTLSKFFHWIIACIVIVMLGVSFFLGDFPKAYQPTAYMIHKSLGLTVLFVMFARIYWIYHCGRPPLPTKVPFFERLLSRMVQYGFYVCLIIMPFDGWVMSVASGRIPTFFGLFSLPLPIPENKALAQFTNQSHKVMAWVLVGLSILHVLGALKHHFFDKDDVLKQMLPKFN